LSRRASLRVPVAAAFGAWVALGLLAYLSIHLSTNALKREVDHRVASTSTIGARLIRTDLDGLKQVAQAYASRPSLRAAVEKVQEGRNTDQAITAQLRELRSLRPGIATTFVATAQGRLIAIDPATPSIVGRNFSFRDWYRGVQRTGKPYVSRAYVSQATGRPPVVAAAVPIKEGGREVGILVAAYRISHFQQLVDAMAVDDGIRLLVIDSHGVLLAEPGNHTGLIRLTSNPQAVKAFSDHQGAQTLDTGAGTELVAVRQVPAVGWWVASWVPTKNAYSGVGAIRAAVIALALALALGLAAGAAVLARSLRRRERAEAELARQHAITQAVLNSSQEAIAMIADDGGLLLSNSRMRHLRNELSAPFGPNGNDRVAEQLAEPERFSADRRLEAADPDLELVNEYEVASSRRRYLRYSAPVADESGRRLGRIITVREVTAEREAAQLKSDLVATVSHELRTPLTGVLGFAELLQQPDLDRDTRERYTSIIYSEASRLTRLINDFLDLQRIEDQGLTLDLQTLDLGDLIRDVAEMVTAAHETHTIQLDLSDEPIEVTADAERLAQVLTNLLSNAIKYSPNETQIHVSAAIEDGAARVSVRDRGIGIATEHHKDLFTKFFRVDSSDTRTIGGTGLGLALARDVIEAHGGRIGLESSTGDGSTFWFELPHAQAAQFTKPRVLIVEDDNGAATLLATFLEDAFDVEISSTGAEALDHARRQPPNVICLDIGLPGAVTGWQVLSHIKSDNRTAHIPVVVCTGSHDSTRATALGAADFLTKPFNRESLLNAVTKLLPTGSGEILVVDDEPTVRSLVAAALIRHGYEIREAADGREALESLTESRPDAIILDLLMPNIDGFTVLQRLHESAELQDIPVLILTAHQLTNEERRQLDERAIATLEKSVYSAVELRRLVEQALGRRPLAGAAQPALVTPVVV
jgi:signal transduction histidine kinase/DNA-binding response OmpR family regulator